MPRKKPLITDQTKWLSDLCVSRYGYINAYIIMSECECLTTDHRIDHSRYVYYSA